MMFSRRALAATAAFIVIVLGSSGLAADRAKKSAPGAEESVPTAEAKARQKPRGAAGKIHGQLQRAFKTWDRDKDESVGLEEMEKVYAKLKVKSRKKQAGDEGNAPDPMAAVTELHALLDADQDAKVTREEFDAWTPEFAAYLAGYFEIQEKRAGIEQELAKVKGILDRNANVTALDGILNDELSRGVIAYEQMLEGLDEQLAQLDTEGKYAPCRDFVLQQILRIKRR